MSMGFRHSERSQRSVVKATLKVSFLTEKLTESTNMAGDSSTVSNHSLTKNPLKTSGEGNSSGGKIRSDGGHAIRMQNNPGYRRAVNERKRNKR